MRRILSLLLLTALLACAGPSRGPRTAIKGDHIQVFLEYHGRAKSLSVVGDFNEWQPGQDMYSELGSDNWRCSLELLPGRYTYLLRVEKDDGIHFVLDPTSYEEVRDGQGRRLSVLDLSAAMGDTSGKK
ncbi:hypothetical protein H8E52_12470 [bacterium]|nr:hypothetical protein [bacterium]